jgi:hypothetical protein
MNERIKLLAEQAGFYFYDLHDIDGQDLGETIEADKWTAAEKFVELMVKDFYDICNQAWAFNEREKAKEGATHAEQLVFAGAMAQCQKMKENIEQQFGVKE